MKREEQKIENTWSIDEIYINDNQINEIKNEIIKKVDEIVRLKGQITKNIDTLHSVFEMDDYIGMKLETLYVYNSMKLDQDHGNAKSQAELLNIKNFYMECISKLSFMTPEILELEESKLIEYANDSKMKKYKKNILDLLEQKGFIKIDEIKLQSGASKQNKDLLINNKSK